MKVSILLSVYNGELFLAEQLESIVNQSFTCWKLYIRDDGSVDNSTVIVDQYINLYPEKIQWINDNKGNLKSAASFMQMLSIVESDYYLFCDQDDVWLPFKIEKTIKKMKDVESLNDNKGVLIFTDLYIVDSNLKILNNSMWGFSNINPENAKNFYKTTCSSSVTGCTIMINNELRDRVLPYPNVAKMHDWWISLIASYYGVVEYLQEPTIYYRQHGANVMGADSINKYHYLKRIIFLKNTLASNVEVLKMLYALPFKVNYFRFYETKFKKIFKI
jgi:glycosyltransferase involved in cell wall biosynthesis